MDEREEQNRDLWQGGPWERSGPQPGSPGAMPPRYVPPRPVLRPRRRKRRFSLPICMGLAALLISLVAISAVMESLWPVQLLPSPPAAVLLPAQHRPWLPLPPLPRKQHRAWS